MIHLSLNYKEPLLTVFFFSELTLNRYFPLLWIVTARSQLEISLQPEIKEFSDDFKQKEVN